MATQPEELGPIFVDRNLTADEYVLSKWMLENGGELSEEYLDQLERARVYSLCGCGCGSVDFSIDGESPPKGPLKLLGDYLYFNDEGECLANVFIFAVEGRLAGFEICTFDDSENRVIPKISGLRPWDKK